MDYSGEKAPGPDGFPISLMKKGWDFTKGDFLSMLNTFFESGNLHWRLNSTYLALIPNRETILLCWISGFLASLTTPTRF